MRTLISIILLLGLNSAAEAVDVENQLCDRFRLSGYLDFRYSQYGEENTVPSQEFAVERSGLKTLVDLSSNFQAELKIEYNPEEVFLKNAFLEWSPSDFTDFRAGQFRKETILGGELSTWNLPLFDRPLVHEFREDLTYDGRDIGVDAEIEIPLGTDIELNANLGVFNGNERGTEKDDNELLFSFRGETRIIPADLTLGASLVSHRLGESDSEELYGYITTERIQAFSIDAVWEQPLNNSYQLDMFAEYTSGDNWSEFDPYLVEDFPRFSGIWTAAVLNYTPWNISSIHKISLCLGYDRLSENTDSEDSHGQLSFIASVYPVDNIRFRFGGVRNTIKSYSLTENLNYTDILAEVSMRF